MFRLEIHCISGLEDLITHLQPGVKSIIGAPCHDQALFALLQTCSDRYPQIPPYLGRQDRVELPARAT
jgi:hypothetical protein